MSVDAPVLVLRAPGLLADVLILAPSAYLSLRVGLGGSASEANTARVGAAVTFDSGEHHLLFNVATSCLLFRAMAVTLITCVTRRPPSTVAVVFGLLAVFCLIPNFFAHSVEVLQVALIFSAVSASAADWQAGVRACLRHCGAVLLLSWAALHWAQSPRAALPPLELGVCTASLLLLVAGSSVASSFTVRLEHSSWVPPLAARCDGTAASVSVNNDLLGVLGHLGYVIWWFPALDLIPANRWFHYVYKGLFIGFFPLYVLLSAVQWEARCLRAWPQPLLPPFLTFRVPSSETSKIEILARAVLRE